MVVTVKNTKGETEKRVENQRIKTKKKKEITEPNKEQLKLKENTSKLIEDGKDPLDFRNIKSSRTLKSSNASPAAEAYLGKRKELERNGYLLDHGNRPNKFPRPVPSPHSMAENGKKLEPCQTVVSEKQPLANDYGADIKEQKTNGLIEAEVRINGSVKEVKRINGLITAEQMIENGLIVHL